MALCAGIVLAGAVTASMFWSRHVTERDRALGLRLAAIGNYQEAEPLLRRALEVNPDDIETLGALTRGSLPSATCADAEPLLNRWCALAPHDAAPFKLRMDFYHRQARAAPAAAEALRLTRAALVDGQHVLTLDPRDDPVAQEVIWLLMQVERFDEADERCRACLQRRPNDPWLTYLLAKISHSRGQATQAQVLLDALLLQHPLFARGLLLRAALHNEAGEPERAVGLLRQLLAFDHTLRNETRYQLSLALARSGKTDEARRVMAEVQKHNLDHILATMPMPDTSAMKLDQKSPGFFEDISAHTNISFTYRNGEEAGHASILESLGGGVALFDYDGDGLLDVFLTGGGSFDGPDKKQIKGLPCKLYRNLGACTFQDVTAEVGLNQLVGDEPWFYSHGCAAADYDNDGWPDLLVTGYGRLALFHNVAAGEGRRRFEDVTRQAGLGDNRWSTSAAWADVDGDGWPDLYVCHYVDWSWTNNPPCKDYRDHKQRDVCPPRIFTALPHVLYRNNGTGGFADVSGAAGLRGTRTDAGYAQLTHLDGPARERLRRADLAKDFGKGLGVLIADLDNDGRPDIYVANDTSGNFLYLNRGNGRFEEVGRERGAAYNDSGAATGSMGVDAADYNGTGLLSVFVANYQNETHALYRNRGQGEFIFASRSAGVAAIGLDYVGFAAGFLDYDLDGNEDLFISNGHVVYHPAPPIEVKQRPILLHNGRRPADKPHDVAFANVSEQAGAYFQSPHWGRGAAFGDLDNDGRVDIVLNPMNEPAVVLRNRFVPPGHWLGVALAGAPYRDAVGARLELQVNGRTMVRVVKGGGSYLSSSDRRVVFGLGESGAVERLTVRWPSGKIQSWKNLTVDRYWKLREGENHPRQ